MLLDVGAGVAAMPIAACREVPGLRAVALEPHPPAADLAERNIAAAGLSSRIELRRQRVEELRDRERYDVVHLPLCSCPTTWSSRRCSGCTPRCAPVAGCSPGRWRSTGMA